MNGCSQDLGINHVCMLLNIVSNFKENSVVFPFLVAYKIPQPLIAQAMLYLSLLQGLRVR